MQRHQKLTTAQKEEKEKEENRRRRKRRQREDEYRRHIERLRRQIEEARKRRQRMMLLFLLAVLAMQESFLAAFQRSFTYQPDHDVEPTGWTPDPAKDYAPQPGSDDHIDGYSYEQWTRMTAKRGIKLSRKDELKAEWEADPERGDFPLRYKDWGYRPYLGEIMNDLTDERWQAVAFTAIKLISPPETHKYLAEAYATDPGDIRQCFGDRDADIIEAFQNRAVLWEERKRREAEEAQKAKKDKKPDDDEKNFEP